MAMRCSGRWIPRATPLYRSNANERLILKWRRSALYEPYPLTPSLSPSVGEGARRAGERDSAWFMVPMRGRRTVDALHEPEWRAPDSGASFLWWGEAIDEPAREDARPTSRFMVPMRDLEIVEAFHETFMRKRQRAAALQDASEGHVVPGFREVLDCASPLALWLPLQKRVHGSDARPILEVEAFP